MGRVIVLSPLVNALEDEVDRRGISYNQAAKMLGVSPQRLSQWRRGARIEFDGVLQRRLAGFIGVSPAKVLEMVGFDLSDEPANLRDSESAIPGYHSRCGLTPLRGVFRPWRPRPPHRTASAQPASSDRVMIGGGHEQLGMVLRSMHGTGALGTDRDDLHRTGPKMGRVVRDGRRRRRHGAATCGQDVG